MAFSISTAWNASSHKDGTALLKEIRNLNIKNVELGFSLSEGMIKEIFAARDTHNIQISSVHNFCPVPDGFNPITFTPDYFSLSSPDEQERLRAVKLTLRSLRTAKGIGAKALIIHAGRVEMEQKTKKLIALYNRGKQNTRGYIDLLTAIRKERERKKKPYLSAILRSLEMLIGKASASGVTICLENRYYHREIPSFDEFEMFFDYFRNCSVLSYWHDVGHAQVGENLGFAKHDDYLKRYGQRMAGIHLHDVSGARDHKVPGTGEFDFNGLKPYLKTHTIRVLEIHQPATGNDVRSGISYLKNTGIISV